MLDRVRERIHPQELIQARAVAESAPVAAAKPRRAPLPLGAPARATAVLTDLRAADGKLGMRHPSAPKPTSIDTIGYLAAVSTAIHADYERHLDTLRVIDDISAVLTEHPELLAPPSHPGPRLWLRRIVAELAPLTAKAEVA